MEPSNPNKHLMGHANTGKAIISHSQTLKTLQKQTLWFLSHKSFHIPIFINYQWQSTKCQDGLLRHWQIQKCLPSEACWLTLRWTFHRKMPFRLKHIQQMLSKHNINFNHKLIIQCVILNARQLIINHLRHLSLMRFWLWLFLCEKTSNNTVQWHHTAWFNPVSWSTLASTTNIFNLYDIRALFGLFQRQTNI